MNIVSHTYNPVTEKVVPKGAIVLEVEDARRLWADLGAAAEATGNGAVSSRLSGVRAQIEAQTKPPRLDEPTLWGVVEARLSKGGPLWQATKFPDGRWVVNGGGAFDWDDLIDPTLIRDGIGSAS